MEQEQVGNNKIARDSSVEGAVAIKNKKDGQRKEKSRELKDKFLKYWAIPIVCVSAFLVIALLAINVNLFRENSYLRGEVSRMGNLIADYEYSWELDDELGLDSGFNVALDENTEGEITNSLLKEVVAKISNDYSVDEGDIEYDRSANFVMCPTYLTTCFNYSTGSSEHVLIDTEGNNLSLSDIDDYFSKNTELEQIETANEGEKLYRRQNGGYYILREISSEEQNGIKISSSGAVSDSLIPAESSAFANELNELSEAKKSRLGEYPAVPFNCLGYDSQPKNGFSYPSCFSQSGQASHKYLYNNDTNKIVELLYGIDMTVYGSVYYYRIMDPATEKKTKWAYATCMEGFKDSATEAEKEIFYCDEENRMYGYLPMIRDNWIVLD